MNFGIAFSPLVPTYVLWGALAVTLVLAAMLVLARSRGALVRTWRSPCSCWRSPIRR